MTTVTVFTSAKELMILTGIETYSGLWNAGFNMDDWDFGIQLDHGITQERTFTEISDYDGSEYEVTEYHHAEDCEYWEKELVHSWMNYRAGGSHTEYNGKHYYLWHHS